MSQLLAEMTTRIAHATAVILTLQTLSCAPVPSQGVTADLSDLERFFSHGDDGLAPALDPGLDSFHAALLAAEEDVAFQIFTTQLATRDVDDEIREIAAYGIALLGGDKALAILGRTRTTDADDYSSAMFNTALMSAVPTDDRIQTLVKAVDDEDADFSRWRSREAAALALGFLRRSDCVTTLGRLANEDESSEAPHAARLALLWIAMGPPRDVAADTYADEIIAAVLRCCPPSQEFGDVASGQTYRLQERRWIASERTEHREHIPEVAFRVRRNRADSRAIVTASVGSTFYTYSLIRRAGSWEAATVVRAATVD